MTTPTFSPEALAGIADKLEAAEKEIVRLRKALTEIRIVTVVVDVRADEALVRVHRIATAALTESPK